LEILEARELLDATSVLLGDLAHLRDDLTISTLTLLNYAQPASTSTLTLDQVRGQYNQMWNALAADCETTWQDFVRYGFTALGLDDRGFRLTDQTSASPPALVRVAASVTSTATTQPSSPHAKPFSGSPPPPPPVVQFGPSNLNPPEGGTVTMAVSLSQVSTSSVSVNYATRDGSATAGKDYTATSGTLTIPARQNGGSFNIPILDDNAVNEPDETFQVFLSNPSGATLGPDNDATITIQEDSDGGAADPPSQVPASTCNCGCPGESGDVIQTSTANIGPAASESSVAPVRYADGVATVAATDLHSDGFGFPWGQTRSWTNGPGYAAGGDNGSGWVDTYTPHLLQADGFSNQTLILVSNGTTARYYDLENGSYQGRFADPSQLTYNSGNDTYTLIDGQGDTIVFNGFGSSRPAAQQGEFASFTDPYGETMAVSSYTSDGHIAEMQRSETSGGNTTTESYLYSYLPTGNANAGLLGNVTLRRQINGGAWTTVRQVQYAYYDGTQQYGGNLGDLMTATVEDGSGNVLSTSYYRYYTAGQSGGYQHGLSYVFNPASYMRLTAALGTNLASLTDAQVAPYADYNFQYDSQQRVSQEVVQGTGSTDTGGLGTYTYSYTGSLNLPDYNIWSTKTVVTAPDGSTDTVYTNFAAEVLLDDHDDPASGLHTDQVYQYNERGQMILQAAPSAVNGYSDSYADLLNNQNGAYQYLNNSSGLIARYDYSTRTTATETTAGGVAGYLQDAQIQQGQQGTLIPQETWQYYAHAYNGMTVAPVATDTVYRNTDGTGPRRRPRPTPGSPTRHRSSRRLTRPR
jgi:hypothetical protein